VEPQQLATKVAQLESRVATLEDEGKIVKGEVKQILTEIRSAILVRDNPFEGDGGMGARPGAAVVSIVPERLPAAEPPAIEVAREPAPRAERQADPPKAPIDPFGGSGREPIPLWPQASQPVPTVIPTAEPPQWSLLTIAGLAAWAEEAMGRLGSLRLEILLDLCETAGHITPEARVALARVTELDIREPERAPSNNETVAILRQLDALVNDEDDHSSARLQRTG
jgi:hypothetical protein